MNEIDLGVAILEQAKIDYIQARNLMLYSKESTYYGLFVGDRLKEIEKFFKSKLGKMLCNESWEYTKKALEKSADDTLKQDLYSTLLGIYTKGEIRTRKYKLKKYKKCMQARYTDSAEEEIKRIEEIALAESKKKKPSRVLKEVIL